jgi:DNA-binding beta-propeller fold protein YncE
MIRGQAMKRFFTWVFIGGTAVMGLSSCAKNPSPAGPFNSVPSPPANYLLQWGSFGVGNGQFDEAQGIAVNAAGTTVYVVNSGSNRVEAFDGSGNYLFQWGSYGNGNGQFVYPQGIAINSAGTTLYVADSDNYRVEAFSNSGDYLTQFGSYGGGNGQFIYGPEEVTVNSAGTTVLVIGNVFPCLVEAFSPSGVFQTQWSINSNSYPPSGIAVNSAGTSIFVADSENNGVDVYNSSGLLLAQWTLPPPANGQYINLTGLALSPDNSKIYLVDSVVDRVDVFSGAGKVLSPFGLYGKTAGFFNDPTSIAVDAAGEIFVMNTGNDTVEKFSGY